MVTVMDCKAMVTRVFTVLAGPVCKAPAALMECMPPVIYGMYAAGSQNGVYAAPTEAIIGNGVYANGGDTGLYAQRGNYGVTSNVS